MFTSPRAAWSLLLAALVASSASAAFADSPRDSGEGDPISEEERAPGPYFDEEPRRTGSWVGYGGVIFLLDAAVITTTIAADHGAPMFGYFLTGPIVHLAHGYPRRSLTSLGVRGGGLVGGAFVGALLLDDGSWGTLIGAAFGAVVGGATAAGFDALYLGRHPRRVIHEPELSPSSAFVVPTAGVSEGGFQLGLSGRF